ncbi:hypothetical protein TCON_2350, partial [Astathelohania contejeani]
MNKYIFMFTVILASNECFSTTTSELKNNYTIIAKTKKMYNQLFNKRYSNTADENALENNYKCNLIIESVFKMIFDAFLNSKTLFSRFTIKYLNIKNNEIKFNASNLPLKLNQNFNYKSRKFECLNSNNHNHYYINIKIKFQLLKLLKELNGGTKRLTPMIEILNRDKIFCICTMQDLLGVYNSIDMNMCIINNKFSMIIKDNIIIINNNEEYIIEKMLPDYDIFYVSIFNIYNYPRILVYEKDEIVIEYKKNEKIKNILFDALKPEKNDEDSRCEAINLYLSGQLKYFDNNDICLMSDKLDLMTKNDTTMVFTKGVNLSIEFIINFIFKDLVDAIKEMIYDLNKSKENKL